MSWNVSQVPDVEGSVYFPLQWRWKWIFHYFCGKENVHVTNKNLMRRNGWYSWPKAILNSRSLAGGIFYGEIIVSQKQNFWLFCFSILFLLVPIVTHPANELHETLLDVFWEWRRNTGLMPKSKSLFVCVCVGGGNVRCWLQLRTRRKLNSNS